MEELYEALSSAAILAIAALATWLSYRFNPTFRAWADGEIEEEIN